MAFIGNNDFFVLEKNTGKVQRSPNGAVQSTVLDLACEQRLRNAACWVSRSTKLPAQRLCYLYWTESSTGVDSTNLARRGIAGEPVDRYIWNGSTLTFDRNLIHLHLLIQADANQPLRGEPQRRHFCGLVGRQALHPDGRQCRRGLLQTSFVRPDRRLSRPDRGPTTSWRARAGQQSPDGFYPAAQR